MAYPEQYLYCVERGKVSAGFVSRLWDMPLPASEAAG
jgi:hypothetical protein